MHDDDDPRPLFRALTTHDDDTLLYTPPAVPKPSMGDGGGESEGGVKLRGGGGGVKSRGPMCMKLVFANDCVLTNGYDTTTRMSRRSYCRC